MYQCEYIDILTNLNKNLLTTELYRDVDRYYYHLKIISDVKKYLYCRIFYYYFFWSKPTV